MASLQRNLNLFDLLLKKNYVWELSRTNPRLSRSKSPQGSSPARPQTTIPSLVKVKAQPYPTHRLHLHSSCTALAQELVPICQLSAAETAKASHLAQDLKN